MLHRFFLYHVYLIKPSGCSDKGCSSEDYVLPLGFTHISVFVYFIFLLIIICKF